MKYRLALIVTTLTLSLIGFVGQASAHTLKTDGSIGAVLHIDPEDDPIVGQPSSFYFEFKDTTGRFRPSQCDCQFVISENGKQIFQQALFANTQTANLETALVNFTFPERNVYTVEVVGKPSGSTDFQKFDLKYDIRASRTSTSAATSSSLTLYIIFGIIAAIVVALVVRDLAGNRRKSA